MGKPVKWAAKTTHRSVNVSKAVSLDFIMQGGQDNHELIAAPEHESREEVMERIRPFVSQRRLNDTEKKVVLAYIETGNQDEAARALGYSDNSYVSKVLKRVRAKAAKGLI